MNLIKPGVDLTWICSVDPLSGFKSEPLPLFTVQHVGFHKLSIRPPRPPALQGDRKVLLHLSNLFLPLLMFLVGLDTSGNSSVTSERDTTVLWHQFTASLGFGIAISQALARIVSCPIVEKCEQHHWTWRAFNRDARLIPALCKSARLRNNRAKPGLVRVLQGGATNNKSGSKWCNTSPRWTAVQVDVLSITRRLSMHYVHQVELSMRPQESRSMSKFHY